MNFSTTFTHIYAGLRSLKLNASQRLRTYVRNPIYIRFYTLYLIFFIGSHRDIYTLTLCVIA